MKDRDHKDSYSEAIPIDNLVKMAETDINACNKLSLPLAVGVSRTVLFSGRPWKFGVQYWHYVESPDDFGPDYQIRFSVSPVVALPW